MSCPGHYGLSYNLHRCVRVRCNELSIPCTGIESLHSSNTQTSTRKSQSLQSRCIAHSPLRSSSTPPSSPRPDLTNPLNFASIPSIPSTAELLVLYSSVNLRSPETSSLSCLIRGVLLLHHALRSWPRDVRVPLRVRSREREAVRSSLVLVLVTVVVPSAFFQVSCWLCMQVMRKLRSEIEDSRGLGQRAEVARVEIEQSWHMVVVSLVSVGRCFEQDLTVVCDGECC